MRLTSNKMKRNVINKLERLVDELESVVRILEEDTDMNEECVSDADIEEIVQAADALEAIAHNIDSMTFDDEEMY